MIKIELMFSIPIPSETIVFHELSVNVRAIALIINIRRRTIYGLVNIRRWKIERKLTRSTNPIIKKNYTYI